MTDVVVLVEPSQAATELMRELEWRRTDDASRVVRPPEHLLGQRFLESDEAQGWWEHNDIAADAMIICHHHAALLDQLDSDLLATWIVWCDTADEAARYERVGVVTVVADNVGSVAALIVSSVLVGTGAFRARPARLEWGPFARRSAPTQAGRRPVPLVEACREDDAVRAAAVQPVSEPVVDDDEVPASMGAPQLVPLISATAPMQWPELPAARLAGSEDFDVPPVAGRVPAVVTMPPAPIAALSQSLGGGRALADRSASSGSEREAGRAAQAMLERLRTLVGLEPGLGVRLGAAGGRMEGLHDLVVGIVSSKGGVGKTQLAAGLGYLGAMALGPRGANVAIVEANPGNADVAIDFGVPPEAHTLRELVDYVSNGGSAPLPHVVDGTRLFIWPDRRQSAGYEPAVIARLVRYLRSQYTFVIADFSNCLPDSTGGPAPELLNAWVPWVDVWAVPMDTSQKALTAAGESIEEIAKCVPTSGSAREPGFVVPLLLNDPRAKKDRTYQSLLDEFRTRGVAVVDIPYVPAVGRAAMNHRTMTEIDRGLTAAWANVLDQVVEAAAEGRGR